MNQIPRLRTAGASLFSSTKSGLQTPPDPLSPPSLLPNQVSPSCTWTNPHSLPTLGINRSTLLKQILLKTFRGSLCEIIKNEVYWKLSRILTQHIWGEGRNLHFNQ